MMEELRKLILTGIGGAALTTEKAQEVVENLVKKGKMTVDEGKKMTEELIQRRKDGSKDTSRADIEAHLIELSASHRKDIDDLEQKVEELTRQVEELSNK